MERTDEAAFWGGACFSPIDRHHQRRLALWTAFWLLALALGQLVVRTGWVEGLTAALLASVLSLGAGIALLLAYNRHVLQADELIRKIHLEALSLAFGVGLVSATTYRLIERAMSVPRADGADFFALGAIVYAVAVTVASRRYSR